MKYSIVIVTYNRCMLLKECIECALAQTKPANHIIVVDNASTDETYEYMDSLNIPQLVYYRMEKNTGGAGGFYEGLRIAHELGDMAHIIIDDDAMLEKVFAEKLCEKADKYADIYAFAGSVYTDGNIVQDHRQKIKRPGFQMKKIQLSEYNKEEFYCDTASFCGLMIRDTLIGQIGLPRKEYFIWYDDTEYCVRIRKLSRIMVVPRAMLNHKVENCAGEWPRHYTWKDYYGFRNRIHMVKIHGTKTDYIVMRIQLWLKSGIRNRVFSLLHLNGEDWKKEISIYKRGVRDGKRFETDR